MTYDTTPGRRFPWAPYRDPAAIFRYEQRQAHYEARMRAAAHERIMEAQATALVESALGVFMP